MIKNTKQFATAQAHELREDLPTRTVFIDLKNLSPVLMGDNLTVVMPMSPPLDLGVLIGELHTRGFNDGEVDQLLEAFHHQMDVIVISKLLADRLK